MGHLLFFLLLLAPVIIALGVVHSWVSVKKRGKYLKILDQKIEELELRVVHFKAEKSYSILGLISIIFPFDFLDENLKAKSEYYMILSPHIEIKVSESEYMKFSGKRFVRVLKQSLDVKDSSPWYYNPWLFLFFDPQYGKDQSKIITYRII